MSYAKLVPTIAAVVVFAAGCRKDVPATPATEGAKPTAAGTFAAAKTTADTAPRKPDDALPVTDVQLAKDYEADKDAADKKFNGKTVLVDGVVVAAKGTDLVLRGTFDVQAATGKQVYCKLVPTSGEKTAALVTGQKIVVRGKCQGAAETSVLVFDGEIVTIGPADPEPAISAIDLTRAYATDKDAADKKYKEKQIVVEGVIAEIGELKGPQGPVPLVTLTGFDDKAAKPIRVEATFATEDKAKVAKLAKGDKVKIKGVCVGRGPGIAGDAVALGAIAIVR